MYFYLFLGGGAEGGKGEGLMMGGERGGEVWGKAGIVIWGVTACRTRDHQLFMSSLNQKERIIFIFMLREDSGLCSEPESRSKVR